MPITGVEIPGWDLRSIFEAAAKFGWIGVIGAAIGLALGGLLASYSSDKGWGDPSSFIYWPLCACGGVVLLASALTL
jgi:hypothetical protein